MSNKKGDPQAVMKTIPNIILKKNNISILKSNNLKSVKPLYKEDIIYQSRVGDFLRISDPAERMTIFNRLNLATMRSHTVVQRTHSGKVVWEKTSEYIASIIGQDNYDIVFSSLCSVISQEFKIRAILALLTEPKKCTDKQSQSCQSDLSEIKIMIENGVQTVESCLGVIKKPPVRRMKRQQTPYVVRDADVPEKVSKVVIYPENFENFAKNEPVSVKSELDSSHDDSQIKFLNSEHDSEHLSMLKCDEDSRDSIGNLSSLSITTTPELMKAPLSLLDQVTEPVQNCTSLTMLDGTILNIPCKIEDDFHVATPEILKLVPLEHRRKLLWYQAYTDWKYCLTRDDDENLPIHLAVLNDDVHLLRRQCLVLKTRKESVDITNGDNMTALQMSILASSPACTALLTQLGANPLVTGDEYRTCFHLAAEAGAEHLDPLIEKCREDPLSILRNSDELWKPEIARKPKDYQVQYLLHKVCTMFDSQGYTPLMLASKLGKHDAVHSLVKAAPSSVDYRATSSGATALYLAVGAACTDSAQRGNKSKVFDDFKKTIEHLVEAGADANIDNYSGSDVNALLVDFNNSELSMVIASKRTLVNCKDIDTKDNKPFMLIKDNDGTIMNLKDQMKKNKEINRIKEEIKKETAGKGKKTKKEKPVILENKVITKPSEEFINTYRNFVHKLKNPALIKNDKDVRKRGVNDGATPSTSKFTPKTNMLKVTLSKPITGPSNLPKNSNLNVNIDDNLIKKETEDTNEVKIKQEASDPSSITSDDKINVTEKEIIDNKSRPLLSKRKIVQDVPLPPLVRIAPKTKNDTPTSPKRQKIKSDTEIDKT